MTPDLLAAGSPGVTDGVDAGVLLCVGSLMVVCRVFAASDGRSSSGMWTLDSVLLSERGFTLDSSGSSPDSRKKRIC